MSQFDDLLQELNSPGLASIGNRKTGYKFVGTQFEEEKPNSKPPSSFNSVNKKIPPSDGKLDAIMMSLDPSQSIEFDQSRKEKTGEFDDLDDIMNSIDKASVTQTDETDFSEVMKRFGINSQMDEFSNMLNSFKDSVPDFTLDPEQQKLQQQFAQQHRIYQKLVEEEKRELEKEQTKFSTPSQPPSGAYNYANTSVSKQADDIISAIGSSSPTPVYSAPQNVASVSSVKQPVRQQVVMKPVNSTPQQKTYTKPESNAAAKSIQKIMKSMKAESVDDFDYVEMVRSIKLLINQIESIIGESVRPHTKELTAATVAMAKSMRDDEVSSLPELQEKLEPMIQCLNTLLELLP